MSDRFLRIISGVDHLKATFWGKIGIGTLFIIYGVVILWLVHFEDIWLKISIVLAFFGLGLTFVLDGQSILREYFGNVQKDVYKRKCDPYSFLGKAIGFLFILGSLLLFFKFYTSENPSLYPITIFLIAILSILIFRERISHFEISKSRLLVKMKNEQEQSYENIESKKKDWGFTIERVKKDVR